MLSNDFKFLRGYTENFFRSEGVVHYNFDITWTSYVEPTREPDPIDLESRRNARRVPQPVRRPPIPRNTRPQRFNTRRR